MEPIPLYTAIDERRIAATRRFIPVRKIDVTLARLTDPIYDFILVARRSVLFDLHHDLISRQSVGSVSQLPPRPINDKRGLARSWNRRNHVPTSHTGSAPNGEVSECLLVTDFDRAADAQRLHGDFGDGAFGP